MSFFSHKIDPMNGTLEVEFNERTVSSSPIIISVAVDDLTFDEGEGPEALKLTEAVAQFSDETECKDDKKSYAKDREPKQRYPFVLGQQQCPNEGWKAEEEDIHPEPLLVYDH